MRTYATIDDMHKVAIAQWRGYFSARISGQTVEKYSDDEIFELANDTFGTADEQGIYGEETDGGWRPWFTMEMESWVRQDLDGTEVEFEILEDTTPIKSIWQQRLESLVVNNLRDYAHSHWKDGEEEDQHRLLAICDRICNDEVADEEWDEILEEVML